MKLNHIDVQSTDVRATAAFFTDLCGFERRTSERSDALCILSGEGGFVLVIQKLREGERLPEHFHVGFHVDDESEVHAFQRRARERGVETSNVETSGRGTMVYCHAPGGILVEVSRPSRTW